MEPQNKQKNPVQNYLHKLKQLELKQKIAGVEKVSEIAIKEATEPQDLTAYNIKKMKLLQ